MKRLIYVLTGMVVGMVLGGSVMDALARPSGSNFGETRRRHVEAKAKRQGIQSNAIGSSGHAFRLFTNLVFQTVNVEVESLADLPGKADDILVAANQRLNTLETNMAAASTLNQYKTANQSMSLFQADLDRINLFLWAIQIRQNAGR